MSSIPDSVSRALGMTAAKRGRVLSSSSEQHDGDRFRNVKPRPADGIGKTLLLAWNVLPTSIIEASLAQWFWKEDVQPRADQSAGRIGCVFKNARDRECA